MAPKNQRLVHILVDDMNPVKREKISDNQHDGVNRSARHAGRVQEG
jgi:hypothetical protein